jgi:predicted enzyme related to lactoylglutathione lyase
MPLRFETLNVDARDPAALARWWGELLGWAVTDDDDDEWLVTPPAGAPGVELLFAPVPEGKAVKNRLHLDLRPDEQDAEVTRAEALGARRVDIGQGSQTWVVLADPEGNEFCILRDD